MLAGTMVYVNAGRELGRLDSLSGILSPGLIISFALPGTVPDRGEKIMGRYRNRYRKDDARVPTQPWGKTIPAYPRMHGEEG